MKIAKFTYSGPDGDGDLIFNLEEATIENDTEYVIELIKTSCLVTNADGVCVGGSYEDEQDAFIDPRESGSININCPWIKAASFGGQLNKMTAIIDAVLFRRDFQKMGELSVPEDHETCSFLDKNINVGGIVDIMGATCKRQEPDDDGDVSVGLEVGVRNVTDEYIDRVSVKMILMDQEDSQIEVSEDYSYLQPHTGRVFTPSVYTKKGRLRNATIRVSVSVYLPVGFKTVEEVAVKGNSDGIALQFTFPSGDNSEFLATRQTPGIGLEIAEIGPESSSDEKILYAKTLLCKLLDHFGINDMDPSKLEDEDSILRLSDYNEESDKSIRASFVFGFDVLPGSYDGPIMAASDPSVRDAIDFAINMIDDKDAAFNLNKDDGALKEWSLPKHTTKD